MKILITGGGGLLGQYLNVELSDDNDILTIYHQNLGNCIDFKSLQADITDNLQLGKIFQEYLPNIVIHNASISSPRMASKLKPQIVYDTNVNSTKRIAELCEKYKSRLIYTSTDLVYAGYRGSMLKEEAKLIPISLYAETKLMGEVKIQETLGNYLILRIALLYGFNLNRSNSENHFAKMYDNFKNNKKIKLFYDQFRTPISLKETARVIKHLCEKNITTKIINVGGKERVSRVELGEMLCDAAGFSKSLIEKISLNEFKTLPMVADVSLNTDKLISLGIQIKSIETSIKEILSDK